MAEARARMREAVAAYERVLGPDHPEVATTLQNLGRLDERDGDRAAAVAHVTCALEIRNHTPGDPRDLAETRFALAQVLGSSKRARRLAREAAAGYRGVGDEAAAVEVERWISSR